MPAPHPGKAPLRALGAQCLDGERVHSPRRLPLAADLALLKQGALAQVAGLDAVDGRLHRAANGLEGALEVLLGHAASTKDVAVGKILRRQIADSQLRA